MPDETLTDRSGPTTPPMPERRPVELEAHGDVRIDDWYWLRDKENPEVIEHLRAENTFTEAATAHTAQLQALLFEEMVERIEETDLSVPVRKGPWLYYHRTVEGQSYGIHCRRPADGDADRDQSGQEVPDGGVPGEEIPDDEVVMLDENQLAGGHDYFALGNLGVSPDHRWLAYSTDTTGAERFTMRFRDLLTGEESPESLEDTSYGMAWANDNATVFFVRVDEAMRPFQLWRHVLGSDPSQAQLVYEEPDEHFYLGVGRTRDEEYVLLGLDSKVTSEVRVLRAGDPTGTFSVLAARRQGVEYSVDHDRGSATRPSRFLVVTNDGAEDFRLLEVPDHGGDQDGDDLGAWREVIPHRPGIRLDAVDPFADHLVVYEREDGETRIRVIDADSGASTPIGQPESPSTVWGGANAEYESAILRYEYTSLVTPRRSTTTTSLGFGCAAQAPTSPGWVRPRPVPDRTAMGNLRRRDAGAHLARVPARSVRSGDTVAAGDPPRGLSSTAMAPTRRRWIPRSPRCGSASSIAASSSPSLTSEVVGRWAGGGTRKGSSWPNPTPS